MDTLAPAKAVASVSLLDADRDPEGFSEELGGSFERYGFAIIADHGIPADLIARAEEKAKAFFALPEEVKRSYHHRGRRRRARLHAVRDRDRQGRGQLRPQGILARRRASFRRGTDMRQMMAPNVWPEEVQSFSATFLELFAAFDTAGPTASSRRSPAISASRPIISRTRSRTAIRCCACSIIRRSPATGRTCAPARMRTSTRSPCCSAPRKRGCNCSTATATGCRSRPKPGELAVNIGDMLQRLTNNVLRSTTHRVVNPPPERRGRLALLDALLPPLPPGFPDRDAARIASSAERPNLYPEPITAHEFLQERLREIKLAESSERGADS